jgi:hypothetical protein
MRGVNPMLNRLMKLFGSLKLAVVLLVILTVVLAVTTFYESATSSRQALLDVYQSWWFNTLLLLLALNIGAAALTRWPWKRKHVGFVVTHAGLIVILGGCSAAFHYGTEGMMDLRVGHPPTDFVRLDDEALTVVVPETGVRAKTVLRIRKDGSVQPGAIEPSKDLRLTLAGFLPNTKIVQHIEEGGTEPNPALQFRLQSELAQQTVSDWLVAGSAGHDRASLGPAQVVFVVAHDAEELKHLLAEPGRADSGAGAPTISISVGGKQFKFDVAGNVDKHLDLGDTGLSAHIAGYWPDFRMDENHKPSSVSDEPNNPATVVILRRGEDEERHFVFSNPQMPPIVRATTGQPLGADVRLAAGAQQPRAGMLTVVLGPDGALHYAAAAKQGFKSGPLPLGEAISPGWMDFQFTAEKFVANAVVSERIEPAPADPQGGFPAVQVTADAAGQQQSDWVRFGQPAVLQIGGKTVHLGYGWNSMRLPFTVALEDFVVERDEGSMNVGGWTSKVVFHDVERGLTQRASISMNNPAWFNGYKFAQASWNPNDLMYSALQVKKDPRFVTWLTWAGAILITVGIILMFWLRRWFGGANGENGEEERVKREERPRQEMVPA